MMHSVTVQSHGSSVLDVLFSLEGERYTCILILTRPVASASKHRLKKKIIWKKTFNYNFENIDSTIPNDHLFQISHVRQIFPDITHI